MSRVRQPYTFLGGGAALAVILFAPAMRAQDRPSVGEWPPVKPDELALKDNLAKPGASAMILERRLEVDDSKSLEEQYYRIKIFNDEGKKYADVEIPYVEGASHIED